MKDLYIEIRIKLENNLLSAVEWALGRDLLDSEADCVRSLITDKDVTSKLGE